MKSSNLKKIILEDRKKAIIESKKTLRLKSLVNSSKMEGFLYLDVFYWVLGVH